MEDNHSLSLEGSVKKASLRCFYEPKKSTFCPPLQVAVSGGEVGSAQGGHDEVRRTLGTPEAVFSFGKGRL